MLILALDISSVGTGYSVLIDGLFDGYGIIAPPKKDSLGAKLLYFEREIKHLITKYNPDHIIVEDIFCFNKKSFKCLAEFRGVAIKTIFELVGKDPYSVMAVEARKIVGVGTKKEAAFAGIIKLLHLKNFEFERDNDIVDSFCLALACHELINREKYGVVKKIISNSKNAPKKKKKKKKVKK